MENYSFYNDILKNHIINQLNVKDLYNLKLSCKIFYGVVDYKIIKKMVILNILSRLKSKLGDKYNTFMSLFCGAKS
jgi:hypothetical protein